MNKPVSFELAKLLKDKGFKQTYEVGVICRIQNTVNKDYEKTRAIKQSDLDNVWSVFNEIYPTIAEVVMWLYERHNVWIEVKVPDTQNEYWSYSIHKPYKYGSLGNGDMYKSLIEAYEAAIEYSLKNLLS